MHLVLYYAAFQPALRRSCAQHEQQPRRFFVPRLVPTHPLTRRLLASRANPSAASKTFSRVMPKVAVYRRGMLLLEEGLCSFTRMQQRTSCGLYLVAR